LEDFGLPPDRGSMSLTIDDRQPLRDRLSLMLAWLDAASSHESDRTVVLQLRDPGGEVVDRAAQAWAA
jgi:hypothetical protein